MRESYLERRHHEGQCLGHSILLLTPGVDVYPYVHLLVLLLVVDPPGQGSEGEVEADHSVLLPGDGKFHLPTVLLAGERIIKLLTCQTNADGSREILSLLR